MTSASPMRVDPRAVAPPQASALQGRREAGPARGRFSLDGSGSAARTGSTASAAPLASLDALLALQGQGDTGERRRRALKRGHDLLEGLDRLKGALLAGRVGADDLKRLSAELAAQRERTSDPGLDDLIDQIELRAQVELAKLGRA